MALLAPYSGWMAKHFDICCRSCALASFLGLMKSMAVRERLMTIDTHFVMKSVMELLGLF